MLRTTSLPYSRLSRAPLSSRATRACSARTFTIIASSPKVRIQVRAQNPPGPAYSPVHVLLPGLDTTTSANIGRRCLTSAVPFTRTTMKEAIVHDAAKVEIIDSPIPTPGPDQVVIKVVVSGSNPKDWKVSEWGHRINSGDDIAGIVHAVGEGVYEFKPGDRVASFHQMRTPGGSFAEYALGWAHTTAHIPENIEFEKAATIPLAFLTAAVALSDRLRLPTPWQPATERTPLIVYGASGAVGAYAIKIARAANIHPVIGIAGAGVPFAQTLIDPSKGDTIVDYRQGHDALVKSVKEVLEAQGIPQAELKHAFDAISAGGSHAALIALLAPDARVANVLPSHGTPVVDYPATYTASRTSVGEVHGPRKDLGFVYLRWAFRALKEGRLTPHPHEVVPGGLGGVSEGLQRLKAGKASAVKYVFRIAETEGVGRD